MDYRQQNRLMFVEPQGVWRVTALDVQQGVALFEVEFKQCLRHLAGIVITSFDHVVVDVLAGAVSGTKNGLNRRAGAGPGVSPA